MTQKTDYFRTFCNVSSAFGSSLKKQELLDMIVTNAVETMGGKAACLFLTEKDEDLFVPVAQMGLSDSYLHANPMSARKLIQGLGKEGHLAFRDATTDSRLENHEAKKKEGIASILTVPVRVRGNIIGVLSLYTSKPREFSQDEIDFLAALADQGGIAIQTARLFERIRSNTLLFLDLAAAVNSSLDIKEILHLLTVRIGQELGMKGIAIRLLDKPSGTLKLVASYGLSDEFLNKGPVSATKSAVAALKGETVVITDVETDDRIQYRKEDLKEGIRSMLVVPIKARDEVIGVMRLYCAVKREFPEDLITMVQALAHQGGLAIRNASRYLSLQDDKKSLEEDIWSHRLWF
ncbi:MAG: GAF domain-containing protein [Desulfobacterales bacterium]